MGLFLHNLRVTKPFLEHCLRKWSSPDDYPPHSPKIPQYISGYAYVVSWYR